jgi:hypothetical protein
MTPSERFHGGATLLEVAAELGVSRERVRQIECAALAKLRSALEREGLSFQDLVPECPEGWLQRPESVDFSTLPTTAAPRSC